MNEVQNKIDEIDTQIQQKRDELQALCKSANMLIDMFNLAHDKYEIKDEDKVEIVSKLKGDEYFRKPMATAITHILQDRKKRNMGPATSDEVYDKLIEGGYDFEGKDSKIAVGTALAKNPKFARIGKADKWVLDEHYAKEGRRGRPMNSATTTNDLTRTETTENNSQEAIDDEKSNETLG
jgi:hypothetical protein